MTHPSKKDQAAMLCAGIDIGSLTAEAVIVRDGDIIGAETMNVLSNPVESAEVILGRAMDTAGVTRDRIAYTVSTGYGREMLQARGLADSNVSEISCHGYGAFCLNAAIRTIIDIGGQDAKVIKLNADGKLVNFVMNEKCAAGTGHFLEVMSKTLEVSLEELGRLSRDARKPAVMSNRCTIYVETEVIHYLQQGVPKKEVAAGINKAMAERVLALARRVKPERKIMITGGVAKNVGVRAALEDMLAEKILMPAIDPQLIGAYGAAMLARKEASA
jgi:predicted CoA-substrate-specific enzyme activase